MGLYDFTFYDLIRCNALTFKGSPAWFEVEDGRSMTFVELKEQTDRLARGLQQTGVKKGDRIGVLAKNRLEYFLVFGAGVFYVLRLMGKTPGSGRPNVADDGPLRTSGLVGGNGSVLPAAG